MNQNSLSAKLNSWHFFERIQDQNYVYFIKEYFKYFKYIKLLNQVIWHNNFQNIYRTVYESKVDEKNPHFIT